MQIKTKGLVIREQVVGEADRLITILSDTHGIQRAFVRGARRIRSKSPAATQLLSYSEFAIYQGKNSNSVDEAQAIDVFFRLREDVSKLALAQYIAELGGALALDGEPAEELLRVILNALHFLETQERPQPQIKAIVELRLLALSGFMPDLVACAECNEYETQYMYFDLATGSLYCENCTPPQDALRVTASLVAAMRHICYSIIEKIFHFQMSDDGFEKLSSLVEKYLLYHIPRKFGTLEFYHLVKD